MRYGIRKINNPDEWLIRLPGGRLDHFGPFSEMVDTDNLEVARCLVRIEQAEKYTEIVEFDDKFNETGKTFRVGPSKGY